MYHEHGLETPTCVTDSVHFELITLEKYSACALTKLDEWCSNYPCLAFTNLVLVREPNCAPENSGEAVGTNLLTPLTGQNISL